MIWVFTAVFAAERPALPGPAAESVEAAPTAPRHTARDGFLISSGVLATSAVGLYLGALATKAQHSALGPTDLDRSRSLFTQNHALVGGSMASATAALVAGIGAVVAQKSRRRAGERTARRPE